MFKSKSQQRFLYAKHPDIADEFAAHTPKKAYKRLPDHVPKAGGRFKAYSNQLKRQKYER